MMLAKTGVTKAGFLLLKRQGSYPKSNQWRSYFVVLNDHSLSYCSESHNFERPEDNVLLTSGTGVYHGEAAMIRIENGIDHLLLKGKDETEMTDWMRAISCNVVRLTELARGHLSVKGRGRSKELFLMLHRECITIHPSCTDTVTILKIYQLTTESSFVVKVNSIEFRSGLKGVNNLTMTASSDIECKHWCYALEVALARVRKETKTIVPPPHFPVHSGTLLYLDDSMKWKKTYVVMTEDCIFFHEHRRTGFGSPLRYVLTPNVMIFATTLNEHSFELVLFSDSIHLSAFSDFERGEWVCFLEKLIPRSNYDQSNPLQMASLDNDVEELEVEFHSESDPGILLERRGNWAIATLVSESLSRKVCQGSVLSGISGLPTLLTGFDVNALAFWKPPLRLSFKLSPRKMGWLTLMTNEKGRRLRRSHSLVWEKVYATLSSGTISLFCVKMDGKSKKRSFGLYGSAVGLVDSNDTDGSKHCFRVLDGIEYVVLQAESQTSQMEWSIAIAHSISMENGGGILLDKQKIVRACDGFGLDNAGFPSIDGSDVPPSPLFTRANDEDFATSIVFAKPVHETGPAKGSTGRLNPISEPSHSGQLNTTHEVSNANLASHENVEISLHMERFASNFFDVNKQIYSSKNSFPVQSLRSDVTQPWHMIDRATRDQSSASEIFDKVSDFGESTQLNDEYSRLVQLTEAAVITKK